MGRPPQYRGRLLYIGGGRGGLTAPGGPDWEEGQTAAAGSSGIDRRPLPLPTRAKVRPMAVGLCVPRKAPRGGPIAPLRVGHRVVRRQVGIGTTQSCFRAPNNPGARGRMEAEGDREFSQAGQLIWPR